MKQTLSRGLRLNNPGCVRHGVSKWKGMSEDQPDPAFIKFENLTYGYNCLWKLLDRYHFWYKKQSVHEIMHRYAPTYDGNNTQLYIRKVAEYVGVDPHDTLPAPKDDQALWTRFLSVITMVEQGIKEENVDQTAIADGYRMAFGTKGIKN